MKIPEHIALSYLLAQFGVQQHYGPWGTALVVAAGCLPDLDGLTLLAGWRYYRTYHRKIGHGIPVTLAGPFILAALASWGFGLGEFLPLWLALQIALAAHLLTDVCFYRWPVQLGWPFSSRGWAVGLLSWNDLVPTLLLYAGMATAWFWPARALLAATLSIGLLGGYLLWRVWQPEPISTWGAWIAGGWTQHTSRFWRWLTGDFVT